MANSPSMLETKDDMLELYYKMAFIRRFEEAAGEFYMRGEIGGYCHLYNGEEGIGVGAMSVLRDDDYIVAPYREHGLAIARGTDPKLIMAELFGKATGVSRGKGGSMHIFDSRRGFLGGDGIVGGTMPIATGVAFAIKYKGGDQVAVCIFGDGAIDQGAFHEAMNISSLWSLPVIFLCENNQFAYGTPVEEASATIDLSVRAMGYEMRIDKADGMDVLAVREVMGRAVRYVRNEGKPTFIEALGYRFQGHSVVDPQKYRERYDVEYWMEKDPLIHMAKFLKKEHAVTDGELKEITGRIETEVEEVVKFAQESPYPGPEELYEDIFA